MSSIYPAGHIVSTTRAASPFPPMFSPEEAKKAKNTHFIDRLQSQPVASQAGHHHFFSPKQANEAKATHVIDGLQSQPVASQADHAGCHQGLPACYRLASAHIIDRLRQPVASPSGHATRARPACYRLASAHIIDRLQSQPVSSQARHHHLFSPKQANEAKATHVIDGLQSQPVASQAGLKPSPSHGLSGWPGRQLPGGFSSSTSESACSKPSRKCTSRRQQEN